MLPRDSALSYTTDVTYKDSDIDMGYIDLVIGHNTLSINVSGVVLQCAIMDRTTNFLSPGEWVEK